MVKKEGTSKGLVIAITIFSLLFIVIGTIIINNSNGKDDLKITERELKYSDFTYNADSGLTSYTIYMFPNIDMTYQKVQLMHTILTLESN